MQFITFRSAAALAVALLAVSAYADERSNNTRRLPAGGNGKAQGVGQGLDNDNKRSISVDKSANLAGTAKQAKNDKKHVGIRGLGISPPGHSDEVDLVVANTFSTDCRVTTSNGLSQSCDTGRVVLTSSADEPTFTVLSTDEATGETRGFSMSGGKKYFKVKQQKNKDVDAEDATDEAFIPPAWGCENEIAGHAAKDKEERRRLLGHSHDDHDEHDHRHDDHDHKDHHHHHHHDDMDLGKALEREGIKLRGTRRLAHQHPDNHRKLETYWTDKRDEENVFYKYSYEVGIYIEVDSILVNDKGGVNGMTQYIEDLFAGMNIIYQKEVDTHLSIVEIKQVNRYDSSSSAGDALAIQRNQLIGGNWPNADADLVHAILGRNLGGGVAYLGQICNTNYGLGVSAGITGTYKIGSPKAMVWDIVVVAHELGHNFGADHTHESYGSGVDTCGNGDCSGLPQNDAGTIMSYCHTCAGSINNIAATLGGHRIGKDDWVNSAEVVQGKSVDPYRVAERMHEHVSSRGECVVPSGEVPLQNCSEDSECNDNNPCTTDSCSNSVCVHTPIDGCTLCGNGVCEAGEDTGNCPSDCPCVDDPNGWYDSYGDGCAWYAPGSNCADYGDSYANLGTTANQACCVCGGGKPTSGGPSPTPPPPTDPCDPSPCENSSSCASSGTSFTCDCSGTGFSGLTCETDVNECADNPCDANASCSNTVGGYTCTCNPGYSGNGATCSAIVCGADQKVVSNACVDCEAGTTNAGGDLASGSETSCDATLCGANQKVVNNGCVNCEAGTTNAAGDNASGGNTSCSDINECAQNTDDCVAGATCQNSNGGFTCTCPSGYTGDGKASSSGCSDINECAPGTNGCVAGATCNNNAGSFTCSCPSGYTGDGKASGSGCSDINECAQGTDDCVPEATCQNSNGGFTCSCPSGYTGDGETSGTGCTPPPPATCVDVTVEIRTDDWGYETSWTLSDASDASSSALMSGNSYADSETKYMTECLPNDANYVFTIYDSYGDGILYGGGYKVSAGAIVLAEGGGNFGYNDVKAFPLGNPGEPPPPCDATACTDAPEGWYDSDGATYNCDWYANGSNCAIYGDGYENLGKTANEACCSCGGGGNDCSAPAPPASSALLASNKANARKKPGNVKKTGTKKKMATDLSCPEKPSNAECSEDCHCPGSFCHGNGKCK